MMADWDLEKLADAYLVDPDDRPLDDARYDPLATNTADLREPIWADGDIPDCSTCHGTGVKREPDPTSSAYFPKPDRTYRCPDCNQETL